ncbi:MAG: LytR C-terminal domain-containing protein [Bacteroidota bacterium]
MIFTRGESSLHSPVPQRSPRNRQVRRSLLNVAIGSLALLVLALTYSFVARTIIRPPVESSRAGAAVRGAGTAIQLDVLNGCGSAGAGSEITTYLRARGYDVVDLRNYKTFDVHETLVIDRTGNKENAERVAYALGVGKDNILQQINPDYYVDVTVVIGKDYHTLKPSQ